MNQKRTFQTPSTILHGVVLYYYVSDGECIWTSFLHSIRVPDQIYGEHFSNMKRSQINSSNCSQNYFAEQAVVVLRSVCRVSI